MTFKELSQKVNSVNDIYALLDNARVSKRIWKHRASSTATFFANPLHYALQQGLGLYFGGNNKTLLGTAVHEGVDYAYNNPTHRVGRAISVLINKALQEYNDMPDEVKNFDLAVVIKKAIKCFMHYYKKVFLNQIKYFVASEHYLEFKVPAHLLRNALNEGKIILTGTFDRLYKDELNRYILGDLKTSGTRISASVEKTKELQDLEGEHGSLLSQIKEHEKIAKKFANSEEKLDEQKIVLQENQIKFYDARTRQKATKAIENKIEKTYKLIEKWEDNLASFIEANNSIEQINCKIQKLSQIMNPSLELHQKDVYEAELIEAKKKYNLQVAQYSLMYMIEYGVKIDRVRIEVVITKGEPDIQIFEWDLDGPALSRAEYALETVIETIEAYFEGTPSRILFKENTYGFYGSETTELLDALWN